MSLSGARAAPARPQAEVHKILQVVGAAAAPRMAFYLLPAIGRDAVHDVRQVNLRAQKLGERRECVARVLGQAW